MEKQIELINKYFSTIRNNNSNINTFFSFLDENEIHYAALGGSVRAALNNSSSLNKNKMIKNMSNNLDFQINYFESMINNTITFSHCHKISRKSN